MTFEAYLNQSWDDHQTQPQKVASTFSNGALLVTTNEQLGQLVGLVTHVMGEHLARWDDGIALLAELKKHSAIAKGSVSQAKFYFEKLSDDDKSWCESSLKSLCNS